MNTRIKIITIFISLATMALISGCHKSSPTDSVNPEVTNEPGNFEFLLPDVLDASATLSYDWINTNALAAIGHKSNPINGTAIVRIKDAGGTEVYVSDLLESGTEQSAIGVPGTWTITVTLDKFDGTAQFTVNDI